MENSNESRKMTWEELDSILGGYSSSQSGIPQHDILRIPCPKCRNMFSVPIKYLVETRVLNCPICGLTLFLDKARLEKARKFFDTL